MALTSIRRYDDGRTSRVGDRAVVVGASMAGLLAARVLADAFDHVTVIDRDPLPDEPVARRGVPQADHVHVMLEAGRSTIEDLLPGYGEELLTNGGLVIDLARDFEYFDEGDFLADGPRRIPMYCASRPLFEQIVRRRVDALDGVRLRGECQFTGYRLDAGGSRVTGVDVRDGLGTRSVDADLVVDATGRTSGTPRWLTEHGFRAPPTDEVQIDLAYSTAVLDRPPAERRAVLAMPTPPRTRGGGVFPIEDDRWVMTLAGVHGDHPPADLDGFAAFAEGLPIPDFTDILDAQRVDTGIRHYPFPATTRRRYWALDRVPDGLVVIGDAIASFNPVYGQGMSVAALEALHLHHAIASEGLAGLPARYFDRCRSVVDDAWKLAVCADFEFDRTTGPKPRGTDLLNRYLSRLTRKAHDDGELAEAFTRVITMERRPVSLFYPSVAWRVLGPV